MSLPSGFSDNSTSRRCQLAWLATANHRRCKAWRDTLRQPQYYVLWRQGKPGPTIQSVNNPSHLAVSITGHIRLVASSAVQQLAPQLCGMWDSTADVAVSVYNHHQPAFALHRLDVIVPSSVDWLRRRALNRPAAAAARTHTAAGAQGLTGYRLGCQHDCTCLVFPALWQTLVQVKAIVRDLDQCRQHRRHTCWWQRQTINSRARCPVGAKGVQRMGRAILALLCGALLGGLGCPCSMGDTNCPGDGRPRRSGLQTPSQLPGWWARWGLKLMSPCLILLESPLWPPCYSVVTAMRLPACHGCLAALPAQAGPAADSVGPLSSLRSPPGCPC